MLNDIYKEEVRRRILTAGRRPDGRGLKDIRPLSAEVDLSPRAHGSGLFTRGETQVLTLATLGTPRERRKLDGLSPAEEKRYMHHYNFPPFSTGEARPLRGSSRREIGHGALAERALLPVLPAGGGLPLHPAPGLGGPVVQRLDVDGLGVRIDPGAAGYRRADQGAGGRHRHGPDQGRRSATPS